MLELTPHPLRALLDERDIPYSHVCAFTGLPPQRVYPVLKGSVLPTKRETELLECLRVKLVEGQKQCDK